MPSNIVNALFVTLLVGLLSGCATPMRSGSQCTVAPGALADHLTFAWQTDPAIALIDDTGFISPIMLAALQNAVIAELAGKGLRFVDAASATEPIDLKIAVALRTRRELQAVDLESSPCVNNDCWERVDMGSSVRMNMQTMGFLSADAYHEGKPIWRGWVERPLYPDDRDRADQVIGKAIPVLFESFPP